MKTYLTYGIGIALANALITLVLFFAGMHNDPAKLSVAGWVSGILGLAIYVTGICMGLKARMAETPVEKPFGYAQAFGSAILISLVVIIAGVTFQYLYDTAINPGLIETTIAAQRAKMEAKGMSEGQIDNAMNMMKKFQTPVFRAVGAFVFLGIIDTVLSLIIAAFFTRKEQDLPPPL